MLQIVGSGGQIQEFERLLSQNLGQQFIVIAGRLETCGPAPSAAKQMVSEQIQSIVNSQSVIEARLGYRVAVERRLAGVPRVVFDSFDDKVIDLFDFRAVSVAPATPDQTSQGEILAHIFGQWATALNQGTADILLENQLELWTTALDFQTRFRGLAGQRGRALKIVTPQQARSGSIIFLYEDQGKRFGTKWRLDDGDVVGSPEEFSETP